MVGTRVTGATVGGASEGEADGIVVGAGEGSMLGCSEGSDDGKGDGCSVELGLAVGVCAAFAEEDFERLLFLPCFLPLPLLELFPCGLGERDCDANVGAGEMLFCFPCLLPLSLLEPFPCGLGEGDCDANAGAGDKLFPLFEDDLLLVLVPLFPLPDLPET